MTEGSKCDMPITSEEEEEEEAVAAVSDAVATVAGGDECQIMSNNCHDVKPTNAQHHHHNVSPMSASFGIMLPGISL